MGDSGGGGKEKKTIRDPLLFVAPRAQLPREQHKSKIQTQPQPNHPTQPPNPPHVFGRPSFLVVATTGTRAIGRKGIARKGVLLPCGLCRGGGGGFGLAVDEPLFDQFTTLFQTRSVLAAAAAVLDDVVGPDLVLDVFSQRKLR